MNLQAIKLMENFHTIKLLRRARNRRQDAIPNRRRKCLNRRPCGRLRSPGVDREQSPEPFGPGAKPGKRVSAADAITAMAGENDPER